MGCCSSSSGEPARNTDRSQSAALKADEEESEEGVETGNSEADTLTTPLIQDGDGGAGGGATSDGNEEYNVDIDEDYDAEDEDDPLKKADDQTRKQFFNLLDRHMSRNKLPMGDADDDEKKSGNSSESVAGAGTAGGGDGGSGDDSGADDGVVKHEESPREGGDGAAAATARRIKHAYPPLKEARLEIKIECTQMYMDPVDSAGLRAKAGGSLELVDDDSNASGFAGTGTPTTDGGSSGSLMGGSSKKRSSVKKKGYKGLYLKADYQRGKKTTTETTEKYNSRPTDPNMIDMFATMSFDLETIAEDTPDAPAADMSSPSLKINEMAEKADGTIEIRLKEAKGALRSGEKLGFASLNIEEHIRAGLIDRSGEWANLNLPLFDMTDAEYKEARSKARRKSMKKKKGMVTSPDAAADSVTRLEIGLLKIQCRLHWTAEQMRKFGEWVREIETESVGVVMSKGDKFDLAQTRKASLNVTVLGLNLDTADLDGWNSMTAHGITHSMSLLETKDLASAALSNVFVQCTHASKDLGAESPMTIASHKHSSQVCDVLYIGEKMEFELAPFQEERAGTTSMSSGNSLASRMHVWNPYYQFFNGETKKMCEESPGTILVMVRRVVGTKKAKKSDGSTGLGSASIGDVIGLSKEDEDGGGVAAADAEVEDTSTEVKPTDLCVEIGCCMIPVSKMFEDVTLEPGECVTNEYLFKEKLFETKMTLPVSMASTAEDPDRKDSTGSSGGKMVGASSLTSQSSIGTEPEVSVQPEKLKEVGYLFFKVSFDWSEAGTLATTATATAE